MILNDFLYYIILPLLSFSIVLVFIRFLKGPSIVDRIIALDLIVTIGIGIISIYSIINNQPNFLDIALILALIAFLGTVAFTYYLEKRDNNE
ncbi:monovalent cation/H+ antiporter complex subunit F [Mesohalobacter halotolerans]|uniref:Cation:proton antiporter n=1 Tax=Mesohalobacter halotolerans TaxID=1883405 RepID=A0A4U5TT69_9FLAO|nr:monovalent cation/H+ antiporter complex subunit F [Mesohalobacter halotolerans]MBS3737909.1 cation:proton antiporter [Psychroflexus sp.]TKS57550.1 cation:proton antiporter [Mesohalobacter halotolerans]